MLNLLVHELVYDLVTVWVVEHHCSHLEVMQIVRHDAIVHFLLLPLHELPHFRVLVV